MKKSGQGKRNYLYILRVIFLCLILDKLEAQTITPDMSAPPAYQPSVSQAGNGVPVVDIQTPSPAGVSRNWYQQFDVEQKGAILNNAQQANLTQQAGWIEPNPHLIAQPANVILNEVYGSNASQLNGFLEVAGTPANVVLANPTGIVCDGCGIVNATRFTLATGTPEFNALGELSHFQVKQGQINIEGAGLNAQSADYTDIIARSADINAKIWANEFKLELGANVETDEVKPQYALDVSVLGGMYANQIFLIGTEAGLGVRNAGRIGASIGQFSLNAQGDLINTGLIDGVSTHINVNHVHNIDGGQLYGDEVTLIAETINNKKQDTAQGSIIGARDKLTLATEEINNTDGSHLISHGTLHIGHSLDETGEVTGKTTLINNIGATIDAVDGGVIRAQTINNLNANLQLGQQVASQESVHEFSLKDELQRYLPGQVFMDCYDDCRLLLPGRIDAQKSFNEYQYQRSITESTVEQTQPAWFGMGGHLELSVDNFLNKDSYVNTQMLDLLGGGITQEMTPGRQTINEWGEVTTYRMRSFWGRAIHRNQKQETDKYNPLQRSAKINLQHAIIPLADDDTIPRLSLPNNPLYQINTLPTAQVLVESNPTFTDYKSWLSSDYMLSKLNLEAGPNTRLGDGYYEQQLLQQQVIQQTGYRFLDNYSDNESQYQSLMDNGLAVAQTLELVPGIALTQAQINMLDKDIVWLVEREVDMPQGESKTVIAPQLYAKVTDKDIHPDGAIFSANTANITTSGDINNEASLLAQNLNLDAANVKNSGQVSGVELKVNTTENVENTGGQFIAKQAMNIHADGDIKNTSTINKQSGHTSGLTYYEESVGDIGLFKVTDGEGELSVAGQNIILENAIIAHEGEGGKVILDAREDILVGSHALTSEQLTNGKYQHEIEQMGSAITSNGTADLRALNDITVVGSVLQAADALTGHAGNDINIIAAEDTLFESEYSNQTKHRITYKKKKEHASEHESQTLTSSVVTAKTVSLQAGNDANLEASQIKAQDKIEIVANNDVNVISGDNKTSLFTQTETTRTGAFQNSGLTLGKETQRDEMQQIAVTQTSSLLSLENQAGLIDIAAGGRYLQIGSDIKAPESQVNIHSAKNQIRGSEDTFEETTYHKHQVTGLSVGASSSALQSVKSIDRTIKNIGDVKDDKLRALGIANAAAEVASLAETSMSPQDNLGNLARVKSSIGKERFVDEQTTQQSTINRSNLDVGQLTLTAVGQGDNSTVNISGTHIAAKDKVDINASGAVKFDAQQNQFKQDTSHKADAHSIGLSIGADGGINADGALMKQNTQINKHDIQQVNTKIVTEHFNIITDSDFSMQGATIDANKATGQIGGKLLIESLQDEEHYTQKERGHSLSASIPIYGSGQGKVAATLNRHDANYHSKEVSQKSGITTGDEGFDFDVQGATTLIGATLSASDEALKNDKVRLKTETLTTQSLENTSEAKVKDKRFALDSDMVTHKKYGIAKAAVRNALLNDKDIDGDSSFTHTELSIGNIDITDNEKQIAVTGMTIDEALSSIEHSSKLSDKPLKDININIMSERSKAKQELVEGAYYNLAKQIDSSEDMGKNGPRSENPEQDKDGEISRLENEGGTYKYIYNNFDLSKVDEYLTSSDGKVHISMNGINTDVDTALRHANQHNIDKQNIYLLRTEKSRSGLSEILLAGYNKFFEGPVLGHTATTDKLDKIVNVHGQKGVHIDAYSRSTLIVYNEIKRLSSNPENYGKYPNMTVNIYGSAANVKKLDRHLAFLQGRDEISDPIMKNSLVVKSETHRYDPVARFIGFNKPNVGKQENGWLKKLKLASGVLHGDYSVHNCYGSPKPEGCKDFYNSHT